MRTALWTLMIALPVAGLACGDKDDDTGTDGWGDGGTTDGGTTDGGTTDGGTTDGGTTDGGTTDGGTTDGGTTDGGTTDGGTTDGGTTDGGTELTDTVVFDFEDSVTLTGFEGAENTAVEVDPTDASNQVARITKSNTAQPWAGVTMSACDNLSIAPLPITATDTTMSLRVWSPTATTNFRVKLEDADDVTVTVETDAATTTAATWQTLTFDFSAEAEGTAALNPAATYSKVSVFPNYGVTGADAGEQTYYVDDLTFLGTVYDTTCPEPEPTPDNLLTNGGFESGWDGSWAIYPESLTNYAVSSTGDEIYGSSDTFTAYEGTNAIKVYGQYTGTQNETPIYQTFAGVYGESYTLTGKIFQHSADPIAGETTYAALAIKFFTADYSSFDMQESEHFTSTSDADTWTDLSVTAAVPEGFTIVQAAIEFWHCFEATGDCYDGGSVYVDDLNFSLDD